MAAYAKSRKPEDILAEAKELYAEAVEAEHENREAALDDLKFGRLGEQWPSDVKQKREKAGRPMLTINRLPAFIRQVVNEARQNKPQIKVKPVDSDADPKTAEVMSGLIRNVEVASDADVAYDTATEHAVSMGFGYWRVGIDYAHDDSFEKEIRIERIGNPFTVYGDPRSKSADSSDWNHAFIVDYMSKEAFEAAHGERTKSDWDTNYVTLDAPWKQGDDVLVCEYWCREEVEREIVQLSDGKVVGADVFEQHQAEWAILGITEKARRTTRSFEVTQSLMTGAEILETTKWAGKYIPIVPVYGDEVNEEGKRHFRSLIRDAKDPQFMFNVWRTTATELAALQPRVPWIGPEQAFQGSDADKWGTANSENHPYIAYNGAVAPNRLPLDMGPAASAIQEAMSASSDLNDIMGLHEASFGEPSNEKSGKAILARQRKGAVSTFHFIDNLSRAIRHTGRILIDLIPRVYTGERIVRTLGNEGQVSTVPINQPFVLGPADENGEQKPMVPPAGTPENAYQGLYRLDAGKYDLVVEAGPSFTTQRQEAAEAMTRIFEANPEAMTLLGDLYVRMLDMPYADEIEKRLKAAKENRPPDPEQQKLEVEKQRLAMQGQADAKKAEQEIQIKREQAQADIEIEWMKARAQIEIEKAKAAAGVDLKREQATADATLKQDQQTAQAKADGAAVVEANAPLVAEIAKEVTAALAATLQNGLTLKMPNRIRVPEYGKDGRIVAAREMDEPQGTVN